MPRPAKPTCVALDIETDTSPLTAAEQAAGLGPRGLDPGHTPVTDVAFCGMDFHEVFTGDEASVLADTMELISMLGEHEHLVTWNGSVFDLPFLAARAAVHGVDVPYRLVLDPAIVAKYDPCPGFDGGYRALIDGRDRHTDLAYVAKPFAQALGVPWSLKPFAEHCLGEPLVSVDRSKMHELTDVQRRTYVASDADGTYRLVPFLLGRRKIPGLDASARR
ncbi:hypothetical protein [Branchiibius sp. NY16-3462-2]|uniref:Predicted 3'-5' exonuclease PolB-like domain-containing protein n=1 Tax=Branchiibius cervicis TaxID=908252 RepID=A0ABW2AU59_9MICO|nr:hypothetical protein [Branchiibius sp. NY16-3462-2]KYH44811.1 hypothetical protein AZH51_12355 [Branchiibius sp. NY16-3462-2]